MLVARAAVVESTDAETGYKVLTVEAGEFAEYATVLDASVPGLIKRGAGTTWLTGANSTFVGPIQIEAGVLGANNGAFGKTGNLTILSGATLDVTKQANSAMNTRKVSFEGIGLGGIGAIICTNYSGYSNRDAMFKNVEMTGDATWESSARHGMTSGGFTKAGGGKLTLKGANTYAGATRLEGGTLVFGDPNGYPGGDLEIAADAVQGTLAAPLLTANTLAFAEGKGVRVTEAGTLDEATFGAMKTVATFTTPLAAVPSLTLVNADGTAWASNLQWSLMLADGGRTLKFGPLRGTQILLR
jgi:autotransporter-associated beta strand protein